MEKRTLQAGTDTSGLAASSFSADVLAAVYKSVLPSRAYTVDMRGHRTVNVPVYTPWSKTAVVTAEAGTITPSDPTFTVSAIELASKAAAAVQVSNEFWADSENTSFRDAIRGILVEALTRNLDSAAVSELYVGAVANYDVQSGMPPSESDVANAMALVTPAAIGRDTALYVHPMTWASLDSGCRCGVDLPAGAAGAYKGFPVFTIPSMSYNSSGCVGVFGDLKRGLGLGLGALDIRVLEQPLAASDQTVVQGVLRYGVKTLQSGCIATLTAV